MNKNTIYYRFSCEKKNYNINFDTTEISIGDIKKEIIKRRNMNDKCPEKFELIFYKENNEQITSDNYKVGPLQKLIIKNFILWQKFFFFFLSFLSQVSILLLFSYIILFY